MMSDIKQRGLSTLCCLTMHFHAVLLNVLLPFLASVIVAAPQSGSPNFDVLAGNGVGHLPSKRATDCGTWTMFCGGLPPPPGAEAKPIEEACNNACFYTKYMNESFVATYRTNTNTERSRRQSGCDTQHGSVCNRMPFSQRFHDEFEQTPTGKWRYNCDEFPMARMAQADFSEGEKRNSLRCINAQHNSRAGGQLKSFIDGTGPGLKGRTCSGPLPDGATFKIDFNYDNADMSKLGFCHQNPDLATLDPWHQFYLTKLTGGTSGRIDFPYKPETNNHYAMALGGQDVLQCKLRLVRISDDTYEGWLYNNAGEEKGHAEARLTANDQQLDIPGSDGVLNTRVFRQGGMMDGPTDKGSNNLIWYGVGEPLNASWSFSTFSFGNDNAVRAKYPEDTLVPGQYCALSDIEWSATTGARQDIECWFPCAA